MIPILTYHGLTEGCENSKYVLRREVFACHLRMIRAAGLNPVGPSELACILEKSSIRAFGKIGLTFDDGCASDYDIALPLLQANNFTATSFVTAGNIGKNGFLKSTHVRVLHQKGVSIQSHGLSHSFLTTLSSRELFRELSESKSVLEDVVSSRVDYLSLPGGRFDRRVMGVASDVGYKAVFSSEPFTCKDRPIPRVGRVMVKQSIDDGEFLRIIGLDRHTRTVLKLSYGLKSVLRNAIGDRNYQRTWEFFMLASRTRREDRL